MTESEQYQQKAISALDKAIHDGKWDADHLVQLIEVIDSYGIIKTIPDYAKENDLSYTGVKKCRKIKTLSGVKFVIDNQ